MRTSFYNLFVKPALLVSLCACALGLALFMPQIAHAETYTLEVTTVIDNASEYSTETSGTFVYGYASFSQIAEVSKRIAVPITEWCVDKNGEKNIKYGTIKITGKSETVNSVPASSSNGSMNFLFNAMDASSENLYLDHIEYGSNTSKITYDNLGKATVSCTPADWVKMTSTSGSVKLHFKYAGPLPKVTYDYDAELSGSKQIDYLNTGTNPDTTRSNKNDYRLYLTAQTGSESEDSYKTKNVIFILDTSGSMAWSMKSSNGTSTSRISSLKSKVKEMIEKLAAADSGNRFTVITYAYNATLLVKNGTSATALSKIDDISASGGTSYYDGLMQAGDIIKSSVDSRQNAVILVSDGVPTGASEAVLGGSSGATFQQAVGIAYAKKAAETFPECSAFYSLYIGTEDDGGAGASILNSITSRVDVTDKNGKGTIKVSCKEDFDNAMDALCKRLSKPEKQIIISDTLSKYVSYYDSSVKMVKTDSKGNQTELERGVDYTVESYDKTTRKVTAKVTADAEMHTKYTLSFDISASAAAISEWLSNGKQYGKGGATGAAGSDYDNDENTSAGQEGFPSNSSASIRLVWENGEKTVAPGSPVIQVKYDESADAAIKAHVTLYNMELTAGKFKYELYDEDGNFVTDAINDANGVISFVTDPYDKVGTWRYTIKAVVPTKGDDDYDENMLYDDHEIGVKVKTVVSEDSDGAYNGLEANVEYTGDTNYYNEYKLRSTHEKK